MLSSTSLPSLAPVRTLALPGPQLRVSSGGWMQARDVRTAGEHSAARALVATFAPLSSFGIRPDSPQSSRSRPQVQRGNAVIWNGLSAVPLPEAP